ncbi:hypothetical protein [Mesoterricola silvestris]|uniref:Uncharacterized protein n=1 Tax=Mesoterricola silvestris TaxID=2927979 RepID=A0AA48GJX2_9BACT|nr:hypothetical protein [Mesoterricola silvestris]BDU72687.1 hypothetical protein METEAL_18610 [Mesoterricola silvestris]
MPPGLIIFLALMGIALICWLLLRSRFYREALGDLEGMRNAPENRMGATGLQNANPLYQLSNDDDGKKPKGARGAGSP